MDDTTGGPLPPPSIVPVDPAGRKAFLLGLVPHLSHDEIWMLQTRLAALDLRADIFGRLPPELQIFVADLLGPGDLGCCLDVSRVWRHVFLAAAMRTRQTRRCFPALVEYTSAVEQRERESKKTETPAQQIFSEMAYKYAVRVHGHFRSVFRHCPMPLATVLDGDIRKDPWHWWQSQSSSSLSSSSSSPVDAASHTAVYNDGDEGVDDPSAWNPRFMTFIGPEYAHGRLFWYFYRQSTIHLLVDDLRTGRRRHFSVKDDVVRGERFLTCSFGDELVVVASTGTRLLAWNYRTGEHIIKQIPAQVDMMATLGRRVCIQSLSSLYVWEMGGMVREVDTTGLAACHRQPDLDGRLPSFFLMDPVRPDVFFRGNIVMETDDSTGGAGAGAGAGAVAAAASLGVVTFASFPGTATESAGTGTLCFFVHEFRALRYCQTYSYRLPFEHNAFPQSLIETTSRCDTRGSFALASWRVSAPSSEGLLHSWAATNIKGVGSLAFNIYTRTFSQSFFRLPPLAPSVGRERLTLLRVHVWNDQLLTLVDRHREAVLSGSGSGSWSGSGTGSGPGSWLRSRTGSSSSVAAQNSSRMRKAEPLLFAFDNAHGEAAACVPPQPFSAVPVYGSDKSRQSCYPPAQRQRCTLDELFPSGSWRVDDSEWAKDGCLLRYILDVDAQPEDSLSDRPAHISNYQLAGDDDFVVLMHDSEYTVWSFRDRPDTAANSGQPAGD